MNITSLQNFPFTLQQKMIEQQLILSEQDIQHAAQAVQACLPPSTFSSFIPRPYQGAIRTDINKLFEEKQSVAIEVYCGGGKTTISAMIMSDILAKSPNTHIVFISPSRASFPHFRKEIESVFNGQVRVDIEQGDFRIDCNVHIKTHYDFVSAQNNRIAGRKNPADFVLENTSLFVVDEAHRYPKDTDNATEIIGKVYDNIHDRLKSGGHALAMTATFDRNDGRLPFGTSHPDIKYTLNDLIQGGHAPDLRGYFVPIKLHADVKLKTYGDDFVIDYTPDSTIRKIRKHINAYYEQIAKIIVNLCKIDTFGKHCVFVSRQKDAIKLSAILNKKLGFAKDGSQGGFSYLVSSEGSIKDRQYLIEALKYDKKYFGYVTCSIGAESIDVPSLRYCHVVAQTKSMIRLMQMVGRITRKCNNKPDCIVIDYKIMRHKIVRAALGINDIALRNKLDPRQIQNGGYIAARSQKSLNLPQYCDITLGQIQDWIVKNHSSPSDMLKQELLLLAADRKPRPSAASKNTHEQKLGKALNAFICKTHGSYDPIFTEKIYKTHWFIDKTAQIKQILLNMAKQKMDRPSKHAEDETERKLGQALVSYTNKTHALYDANFTTQIQQLAPDWFLDTAKQNKEKLLMLARNGGKKPSRESKNNIEKKLAEALSRYINPKRTSTYDPDFTAKIRELAPDWFNNTAKKNKKALKKLAKAGAKRPSSSSKNLREKQLGIALLNYTNPKSSSYDHKFSLEIRALRPSWFDSRRTMRIIIPATKQYTVLGHSSSFSATEG